MKIIAQLQVLLASAVVIGGVFTSHTYDMRILYLLVYSLGMALYYKEKL